MNEVVLSDKNIMFKDNEELARAWLWMSNILARAKELKKQLDKNVIEHFELHNIKELELGGKWIISVSKTKEEKFKTEQIYDLFNFTEVQRRILPKNPAFKKTELKLELGEDFTENINTIWTDKVEVKEINTEFIKGNPAKEQLKKGE